MYRTMRNSCHSYPDLQLPNFLHQWVGWQHATAIRLAAASTLRHAFTQHADSVFHYYRTQLNDLYEDFAFIGTPGQRQQCGAHAGQPLTRYRYCP